ncbi:hypothetical protein MMC24_000202 [Lignoscripta atroalba]|nr:hypothetical protein [Lignoscripta atroalba]
MLSTSESSPAFAVLAANHTGITVSSLARSLKFWHDILGLPLISQTVLSGPVLSTIVGVSDATINIALLSLPNGIAIELLEYKDNGVDVRQYKPRSCDVGSVHVALNVTGLDVLVEKMREVDWVPLGEVQLVTGHGVLEGWKLCYCRGPDGETVELMEPPGS